MRRTLHILLALLALNLIGAGLLWFGYSHMQDEKIKKAEIEKELAVENQKGERLQTLRRTLMSVEADRVTLTRYLFDPSEESQIKFLSLLEDLGEKTTGATVVTSTFDVGNSEPKVVHTELAVSGEWQDLYRLLRIIENVPTHAVVNRYSVTRKDDLSEGKARPLWQGSIVFDIMSVQTQTPD